MYLTELETQFRGAGYLPAGRDPRLGTEYGHTLAMVNAAEKAGRLDSLVVSIQDFARFMPGIMPRAFRSRFSGAAPSVMLPGGTIS